ncbi:14235_t:CDS:1 [Cetraspora pellucida]|uniref:14235_t:CDS:1 n=1 Tax=Cetraspora pellucida TaxID=1433469 RepID=A0ACA9N9P3_9GLOM|nr:14235_t:CDS:1 [Cetraspora pellucida]
MVLNVETEFVQNIYSDSIEDKESEVNELVVDLTYNADPTIVQNVETYMKLNNAHILTEEKLDNHQIVEIVLAEKLEYDQGDPDDSDEEPPCISVSEGLDGLKNFISFVEQQMNNDFDKNDLTIFRKYVTLMRRKTIESLKQKSITDFFSNVAETQNTEDFLNDENFLDDNFPNNFLDENRKIYDSFDNENYQ